MAYTGENFNTEGKKAILSIDGGGMRGVIATAMLMELEDQLGKPTYEIFDMVAGTSIGAVIAASLAVKMSAHEIMDVVFKKALPEAFGNTGFWSWVKFALTGFKYRYSHKPFIKAFEQYLDIKVSDVEHIIFLMTTKDVRTGNTYFITNAGQGAPAFADWPLLFAAGASGSAPVYFPPVAGNLIDGGVGPHGNPSFAAASEALDYIGEDYGFVDGNVILYSFGTGYPPQKKAEGAAGRYWAFDWLMYIINEMIDDSTLQAVYATQSAYGERVDYRRYNPALDNEMLFELDIVPPEGIKVNELGLDSTSEKAVSVMEEIGRKYAREIDWNVAGVMPWQTTGGHKKPEINNVVDFSDFMPENNQTRGTIHDGIK